MSLSAFVRMRFAAFSQTPDQVFKRKPGNRILSGPCPAKAEAVADWQFALLSVAAYGRSEPKRQAIPTGQRRLGTIGRTITHMWKHRAVAKAPPPEVPTSPTPDVDAQLVAAGWTRWPDFPDPELEKQMMKSHLRAEVWDNAKQSLVVVAFGGTVFTSGKDWASNLRWFTPWHKDEYSQIVTLFAPDFVTAFAGRHANGSDKVTICSTGHSLGGGLAQQFAYALPAGMQRVSKVYAFDPSPVTGFYSVDRATRQTNRRGLQISRIYERGEILAMLRSFTSLIIKPSSVDPTIRGVRFNLFYAENAIAGHSIVELASKMQNAAGVVAWKPPVVHAPTRDKPVL